MKKLIRIDKNGTKYWGDDTCRRCGGQGERSEWYYTGMICYECGGTGHSKIRVEKEYTPEYEVKLADRRAKRQAKLEAEHAEEIAAEKAKEEADRLAKEEAERKGKEEEAKRKAISNYVGQVGEKLIMTVTFDHTAWYTAHDPFGREETRYIHNFRDERGNLLVWKTSSGLGRLNLQDGETVRLKGTVKAHSEYKDEKQTVLLRCKVVRSEQEEA